MEKEFKYCGEIIDHSWFDDPEAYDKGTYYPIKWDFIYNGWSYTDWNEFYQFIDNSKKVYLDEYPDHSNPCEYLIPDLSKVLDKSIEESINKSILFGLGLTEDDL